MKIAVLSDIHGNNIALQTCMEYLEKQAIDAYCFLGDYIGDFPQIRQVMDTLYRLQKSMPCYLIRGNKEEYILSGIGKHTLNGTVIRAQSECCDTRGSI